MIFFHSNIKHTSYKGKNKLDCIKIKNFCASKSIIKIIKRQHIKKKDNTQNEGKIFGNHVTDELISKIHFIPLTLQQQQTISKWAKVLSRGDPNKIYKWPVST